MLRKAAQPVDYRFRRFEREFKVYESEQYYKQTLDTLLDLLSTYRKTHNHSLKLRIVMLMFELNNLNSKFEMEVDFDK